MSFTISGMSSAINNRHITLTHNNEEVEDPIGGCMKLSHIYKDAGLLK